VGFLRRTVGLPGPPLSLFHVVRDIILRPPDLPFFIKVFPSSLFFFRLVDYLFFYYMLSNLRCFVAAAQKWFFLFSSFFLFSLSTFGDFRSSEVRGRPPRRSPLQPFDCLLPSGNTEMSHLFPFSPLAPCWVDGRTSSTKTYDRELTLQRARSTSKKGEALAHEVKVSGHPSPLAFLLEPGFLFFVSKTLAFPPLRPPRLCPFHLSG